VWCTGCRGGYYCFITDSTGIASEIWRSIETEASIDEKSR
jgi:hypothetical protein